MSTDAPLGEPGTQRASTQTLPEFLRGLGEPAEPAAPSGWTRRRLTILGVVAVVVLAVLGTGSYVGYRLLAPYYGLGYHTGGSVTVDSVRLTVTGARCELARAPFGNSGTPHGAYCAVTVSAHNTGSDTAFINARTWTVDLDVGLTGVLPVVNWLPARNVVVEPTQSFTFDLVYDIPKGARLQRIRMDISGKHGTVPLS